MRRSTFVQLCLATAMLSVCSGCLLPRTTVHKDPGPRDKGVRYYRPKPYLKITPLLDTSGKPVSGYVSIENVTLPDFSEEYSIHVRSGLGSNNTQITLTDGWNLTGLNVQIDSQFDETLKAIADVVNAVPFSPETPPNATAVKATNVPLGLYEAVLSKGPDCRKRLYGFRYVGFMPYASCPLESCGSEQVSCYDGQIYGLVFDSTSGAMVFKQLHDIAPPAIIQETFSDRGLRAEQEMVTEASSSFYSS